LTTYKTAAIAKLLNVHPNTVRLYEKWRLIPPAKRLPNGYRIFTDFHLAQGRLVRLAFQVEVLQNGLRKKIIQMLHTSAAGNFDEAIALTLAYLKQLQQEQQNAEEAIQIVKQLLVRQSKTNACQLKRKEAAKLLDISPDTLRNWEMNGLLNVKRRANGYRVYTGPDIQRLKVIRSLRCAGYSLESILRLLQKLAQNPAADIRLALNTPKQDDEIISVCDRLIVSLTAAEHNAQNLLVMLQQMKTQFS
jgi:DNA-binding transcriptional MerR regulator